MERYFDKKKLKSYILTNFADRGLYLRTKRIKQNF